MHSRTNPDVTGFSLQNIFGWNLRSNYKTERQRLGPLKGDGQKGWRKGGMSNESIDVTSSSSSSSSPSSSSSAEETEEKRRDVCLQWAGLSRTIPILLFLPEAIVSQKSEYKVLGERYHLAYKMVRTESRLIRNVLAAHSFCEVHQNSSEFNLLWTGSHPKPFSLRNLAEFQKVNHFPRSYELTRKDRLYKNIQRMQHSFGFKHFNFVPPTFLLPSEYQEFCIAHSKEKAPWIVKPVASSRGRGVFLVNSPSNVPMDENLLVSRYLSNPLLIDQFKFDVRLYVLVSSYDPLLIYLYEEGLTRFATVKYDRSSKHIKNQFMHLTNYSVNKKSGDYVSCDDPEVEDFGNKWSMSAMLRYLKHEGINTTELMSHVEELIIKTVMAVESPIASAIKMFVPYRGNCFELYGFDVLIDSDLKPWLLEVNLSPSLACDAPLDLKIKASMVADMFSLVGFICQDPSVNWQRGARVGSDGSARHSSRPQRPSSSQVSFGVHRPASTNVTNKHTPRTIALSSEETKVLRRVQEEYARRGSFIRIFPTQHTWDLYGCFLEYRTTLNTVLASYLFTDRGSQRVPSGGGCQSTVIARTKTAIPLTVHSNQMEARQRARRPMSSRGVVRSSSQSPSNTLQYERKLLSLEKRGECRRRRKGRRKKGQAHKVVQEVTTVGVHQELTCLTQEEGDGSNDDDPDMMVRVKDVTPSVKHPEPVLQGNLNVSSATNSRKSAAILFLEAGKSLSKVQARHTFSSYLQRVQQRLVKESCILEHERESHLEDEKMDIVVQFLCRAAENLQRPIRLALPGRKLPLYDRKRILARQLGEFLHYYNRVKPRV
uniref:tubulin polyglutamylase TTLL5-like n=1 Tax=Myxine glutinosa TaxID=7769 RepID=UPI00358DEDA9